MHHCVCGYISLRSLLTAFFKAGRYACRMLRVWSGLKQVVIVTMATCCCHDATNAPSLRNLMRDLRTTSAVHYSLHSIIVIHIHYWQKNFHVKKSMHVFAPCMSVLMLYHMYTVYIHAHVLYVYTCMYIRIIIIFPRVRAYTGILIRMYAYVRMCQSLYKDSVVRRALACTCALFGSCLSIERGFSFKKYLLTV